MAPDIPANIAEQISNFTGRTWLLPVVLDWLEKSSERLLLLTGLPGTGKSMLAAWLAGHGPMPAEEAERTQLARLRTYVKGAHFCQQNAGSNLPMAMASQLALQLSQQVPGYAKALAESLPGRVDVHGHLEPGIVESGGLAAAVYIENLNIKDLSSEIGFETTLRNPLRALYKAGYDQQVLLIIDSLDEAFLFKKDVNIAELLARLEELDGRVRFLATTRPDPRLLKLYSGVPTIDLVDAPQSDPVDLYRYVKASLASLPEERRTTLADDIFAVAQGNFLYAYLAVSDVLEAFTQGRLPAAPVFPPGLYGMYQGFLNRELGKDEDRWNEQFRPVLGLLAVAQGPGMDKDKLERITTQEVEPTLRICKQYLAGALPDGPFRPFHKSFADFLLDEKNLDYRVRADRMHARIARYYLAMHDGVPAWQKWDNYGMQYAADHLAGASQTNNADERHEMATHLVELVLDSGFQQRYLVQVQDLASLQADLEMAVRVAATDTHPQALARIVRAVRELVAFRTQRADPQRIFDLAVEGKVEAAVRELPMFSVEVYWRQAAALLAAWLAVPTNRAAAAHLYRQLVLQAGENQVLALLSERLAADLEERPPHLPYFRERHVNPEVLDQVLLRLGGKRAEAGMIQEFLAEMDLQPSEALVEVMQQMDDNMPVFLAQQDGPLLVDFARHNPEEGARSVRQYLHIHAANHYVYYRNLSLWLLLKEILSHPSQAWTLEIALELMKTALHVRGMEFSEAVPLVELGLRGLRNSSTRQELDQRREAAKKEASHLEDERGKGDTWGESKRRFAALAQAYSLFPGQEEQVRSLLARAASLPRGFSGFMYTAWLNLAEAVRVCRQESRVAIEPLLAEALSAAHHIQDATFCARATARVNAIQRHWSSLPAGPALSSLVRDFASEPDPRKYSAQHQLREQYSKRAAPPENIPLPSKLLGANTLTEVASAFGLSVSDFLQANAQFGWQAHTSLPNYAWINVPDSDFIPLIATHCSAAVVADTLLSSEEKRALLQLLVPSAAADSSALDTVLARLYLVAAPTEEAALNMV